MMSGLLKQQKMKHLATKESEHLRCIDTRCAKDKKKRLQQSPLKAN
jgi:hypothetical protein